MSDGCVFCERIAARQYIACGVSSPYVNDGHPDVVRFAPLNPVTPGHMLFVPRRHDANAGEGPVAAGHALTEAARYIADEGIDANIITSIGAAATQTVMHTHVHVVPRRAGDGLTLPWTGQRRAEDLPVGETIKACARCHRPHTYRGEIGVSGMRANTLGLPTRVVHVSVDRKHTGTQVYCLDCWFDAGAPRTIEL